MSFFFILLVLSFSLLPSPVLSQSPPDTTPPNPDNNVEGDENDGTSNAPTVIFYGFFFFLIFLVLFWLGLRRWLRWRRVQNNSRATLTIPATSASIQPMDSMELADDVPVGVPVQPAQWPPRSPHPHDCEYGSGTVYRLGDSLHSPQHHDDVELVAIEIMEPPDQNPDDHSHQPAPAQPPPTYADIVTKKTMLAGVHNTP